MIKSIKQASENEIKNKRILIRVDYNVPIQNKKIIDDSRIKASFETINYVLNKKPKKIILISHLGRPKDREKELSLHPVFEYLKNHFKDIAFKDLEEEIKNPCKNKIILLENIRYYQEEENNDQSFSKKLSSIADLYINDAFGTMHRKHSSTYGITDFLPSYFGLLVQKEIENLDINNYKKPFYLILGGAKLSTKLPLIERLIEKSDKILLGGAMIFTFYKALGHNIGKSLYEPEIITHSKELLKKNKILLPEDVIISKSLEKPIEKRTVAISEIPDDFYGVDIGEKTIKTFSKELKNAKTILWNGPLGIYEINEFRKGSEELAKAISELNAKKIIGGGDTVAMINNLKLSSKYDFISTGGGATLEFLSKATLPLLSKQEH